MHLLKELPELVQAGVIPQDTADKIQLYYRTKAGKPQNRLLLVSGILGALLIGLGIILIIAHNWDDLSRSVKTVLVFLPLLIGQLAGGYTLLKKQKNSGWRESSATFLFLSVGATIALVSQVYHIPGNLSTFLFTWMLLCLPLVYLLKSNFASLLFLAGITWYAVEGGYGKQDYTYWWLLLLILPHYFLLCKSRPESNFTSFHHWLVPLSLLVGLGTVASQTEELLLICYMSLLGVFILVGYSKFFKSSRFSSNGYLILGYLGSAGILITMSFKLLWENISRAELNILSPEMLAACFISGVGITLLVVKWQKQQVISLLEFVFLFFILLFALAHLSALAATIFTNLLVLIIGLTVVRAGARRNNLGLLNAGLLFITALIVARFFDTNMSFVLRGILFVLVGLGFFLANFYMLKKRTTHEA
ncbi:DUF2157 domain-containing protein [Pontibacter sp. 13R65]|uniref:DUF2157 domain-containing protein n=1 Tax=Pontibacter sp. 13R65 TaxID=3127458 RepID=UPI00301CEDB5